MSKKQTLKDYIEFKKLSVNSIAKIKDIQKYMDSFLKSNEKPLEEFTEKELISYLNSLNLKPRTLNDRKKYLKNFIKWKFEDYSTRFRNLDNICKSEKPLKAYEPEQMISKKDVEKLVKGEKDLMYKVFWLVYFYGGFRPIEALSLEWSKDINFENKGVIIKLQSTKTKKTYYKTLPKHVEEYLIAWKEKNESKWVFPSPVNNNHLHIKSAAKKLSRLSGKVLDRHINLYALRHSIATILYNDDSKLDDDVAAQMGHSKSMKENYLHLDEGKIKARARKMYLKAPKLSKEKQEEYEARIKKLEVQMKEQTEMFSQWIEIRKENDQRFKDNYNKIEEQKSKKTLIASQ